MVNAFAWIFTLATIGLAETAYLIRARRLAERPVCPIGGNCQAVLGSKYNRVLGFVHNDVLGGLFYLAIAVLAALAVLRVEPFLVWPMVMTVVVALGSLMSLGLIFLQWKVIKAWCFWCLMSATTVFAMAFILLAQLYSSNP